MPLKPPVPVREPAPVAGASPPFLTWPVSQREFYRTICLALIPALAWGVVLFGSRTLAMLGLCIVAATLTYLLLKRWLKWERGKRLLYMHCLLSILVMVALAHPTWPIWVMIVLAAVVPLALAVIGGPGRERIHIAVAAVLIVQYVLLPHLSSGMYAGKADAILARNRLFMGDIRYQSPEPSLRNWPLSNEIDGYDAVPFPAPAVSAANTLDQISDQLPSHNAAPRPGPLGHQPDQLSKHEADGIRSILDRAFVKRFPGIELLVWGVAPNRVGAASLIALTLAGLYLSYRYILRPRSVLFFLLAYVLGTALFLFSPATIQRVGVLTLWDFLKTFPGETVTLFNFLLFNSDAAFAGVIILALPGTEPLTARGRRIFLALAAVGAAGLHRLDPTTPAATLALCILMPAAPLFDRVFTQRSWLNP